MKPLISLSVALLLLLNARASECEYCSIAGQHVYELGYPDCATLMLDSAMPHCESAEDLPPENTTNPPKDCIWVVDDYININYSVWEGTPVGDANGHHCEDMQLVDEGDVLVEACASSGLCWPLEI
jgi:hypothetical protein